MKKILRRTSKLATTFGRSSFATGVCALLAGVVTFALADTASGGTYTTSTPASQHITGGKDATGTLDLTTDGFVTPGSAASFTVTFDFDRPNSSGNSTDPIVYITLDGLTVLSGGTVPDMGTSSYTFTQSTTDGSTLLSDINSTGMLIYDVSTGTGNYYLDEATLTVDPAPDTGATAGLLGLAMAGVSFLRRKLN